jgi:hypothetical protein
MDSTGRQLNPWEGPWGRRRHRIHQELRDLGETGRWWADACRFIQDDTLETGAHMAFHALREMNGTLLDLFVPIANLSEDPQRAEERERLAEVLADAGYGEDVIEGAQGRLTPGEKLKIAAVCQLLELGPEIEKTWGKLGLHGQAHRRNLGMRAITDDTVMATFDEAERVIGAIAERWARHYPAWAELVDEIAAAGPTKENVKRLLESVPPIFELLRRFFASIVQPDWLPPLRSQGLLARVPAPEISDDETSIRYLPWPAATFLATVAEAMPVDVHHILLEVANSENPLALHAVISIAAELPIELSTSLVPSIGEGVVRWRGVSRTRGLIASFLDHLVSGGAEGEALELAKSILALDGANHVGGDQPQEYRALLGEVLPALGRVEDGLVLDMLVDILGQASGAAADRSVVWLRQVDEPVRYSNDCRPLLAKAVLELTKSIAEHDGGQVLRDLMASGVPAAQRVALYLARVQEGIHPTVVLDDMTAFGNHELRVELGQLVRDRWDDLGDAQSRYLAFIAGGPPAENVGSAEDSDQLTRTWRGYYFQPINDKLDPTDPTIAGLLDGADVPEHDVLARYEVRVRVAGHDSPWSADEMLALDAGALIDRIRTFTPGEGPGSPSWRGIGETLARVVADDVERYRQLPARVGDIAPEILYGVLGGVTLAARRAPIDWEVVVDAAFAGARWSGVRGGGWDAFDEPQIALRHQALAAIRARLRHNEPLPDVVVDPLLEVVRICLGDEQPPDGAPWLAVGPVGDLPHTVRNTAFATLVDLISAVARTRDDVSLVGGVLADALENERNPYVFAEAAKGVNQLAAHAPGWLRDNVAVVFGPPGSDDPRHRVAWEVFSYSEPERIVAELLASHYAGWVDALTGDPLDEPGTRIAGHVGALAAADLLPRSTLERFFEVAPVEGRAAALSYAVPAAAAEVEGAMELWEWRAASVEAGGDPDELTAVTAWMRSDLLPASWLLEQVDRATRLGVPLERPDTVLIYLSKLGATAPESGEVVLDSLERVLAQAELRQLALSSDTVVGIINRVSDARTDLKDRVAAARATASLRLQDPTLFAGNANNQRR